MQFAAAEPFPNRTRLRLRFRHHRRQGIDPKFFDSWSRNGIRGSWLDQSPQVMVASSRAARVFRGFRRSSVLSLFFPPVDVALTHIAVDVTIHWDERIRAGEQLACRRVYDAQFAITEVVIDKPADVGQSLGPRDGAIVAGLEI